MTNANERFHGLDALRGSMMLLGVVLHVVCAYATIPHIWWYKDGDTGIWADAFVLAIHTFRLPVFFVMAGFFSALLYTKRGWSGLAVNRAKRLFVPFVLFLFTLFPLLMTLEAYNRDGSVGKAIEWFLSNKYWHWFHPMHLWFLLYLIYIVAGALVVAPVLGRLPLGRVNRLFRRVVVSSAGPLLPAVATFVSLTYMPLGVLETPHDFAPVLRIVGVYAVFFGFGWALYLNRDLLPALTEWAWMRTIAGLALIGANFWFVAQQLYPRHHHDFAAQMGSAATGALLVWLLTFGLIGLCMRYLAQPSPALRYLSDSAYWQYLVHPVVLVIFQYAAAPLAIGSVGKTVLVTALSAPVLLISYSLLVRGTWMGVLLNGRRIQRTSARAAAGLAAEAA